MDLLDFTGGDLYYDTPPSPRTAELLRQAAECYPEAVAEGLLLEADALEPEHLEVLVALYRYYFYRHELERALAVAERALRVSGRELGLPADWRGITAFGQDGGRSMVQTRFYLMALKGAGYLELRLGRPLQALDRLRLVERLDGSQRLGVGALIQLAEQAAAAQDDSMTP